MANVPNKILDALDQLDPTNPGHWTDDGLPVTKVVQDLASDPEIKRSDITAAAPGFSRESLQAKPAADPITGVMSPPADETGAEYAGDDLRAKLDSDFATATQRVEQLAAEVSEKQKEHGLAIRARDKAMLELHRQFPPMDAAENIQQYLASEQNKRAQAAGVPLASTLDRALFGRKAPLGFSSNVRQRGRMVAPPVVQGAGPAPGRGV